MVRVLIVSGAFSVSSAAGGMLDPAQFASLGTHLGMDAPRVQGFHSRLRAPQY
jgi:hypothetical protein